MAVREKKLTPRFSSGSDALLDSKNSGQADLRKHDVLGKGLHQTKIQDLLRNGERLLCIERPWSVTKVGTGLRLHRQDKNGDDNKNREQKKKPSHIVLLRAQHEIEGRSVVLLGADALGGKG
jgi:hypothetical protein